MLIEFSCPACKAQLSVEDKVAGRKVDCPKCKELIIIPVSISSLSEQVAQLPDADILRSVVPYRKEMLAKHNKLIEAIEEIKLRNDRIRELESNSLRIQKELWAIEVEFEQRKDAYDKAEKEKRELKKRLNQLGASGNSGGGSGQNEIRSLQHELDNAQRQITTLEKDLSAAGSKGDKAAQEKFDQEISALQEELDATISELEEADNINMALKAEISGLAIGINQRDAVASQAHQQVQQALGNEKAVASLARSTATQLEALTHQEIQTKGLEETAAAMSSRLKELEKKISTFNASGASNDAPANVSIREENMVNKVNDLTAALVKTQEEKKKALQKVSDLEDRYKSLENKLENDKSANQRLAKITTSFTALEKNHLSLERKHETLAEENSTLKLSSKKLEQLAQLENENMEYVERIAAQENDLKELQAQVEQLQRASGEPAPANGVQNGKAFKAASDGIKNEDLKGLHDRLSKLEITSDELATENARLKNTVRTLTENLKAQWKKRDAKIQTNRRN